MISLRDLIEYQVKQQLSDLHFITDEVPLARNHDGELVPMANEPMHKTEIDSLLTEMCSQEELEIFSRYKTLDLAKDLFEFGRFRVNLFTERRGTGMNIRIIPDLAGQMERMDIPDLIRNIVRNRKGLMLISGPNNAGKTTLMNACIDILNTEQKVNIITFEDPIEFIHTRKNSLISQREITKDGVKEMRDDLKSVFRQDADVICIGEIRDHETMQLAIEMCETGYFVMATIHSTNALQTLMRIVNLYESENRGQFLSQIADQLKGVVCQHLVPGIDGKALPCRELLVPDDGIRNLIRQGEFGAIRGQMEVSANTGNILFDHYLVALYENKLISQQTLLRCTQDRRTMELLVADGA